MRNNLVWLWLKFLPCLKNCFAIPKSLPINRKIKNLRTLNFIFPFQINAEKDKKLNSKSLLISLSIFRCQFQIKAYFAVAGGQLFKIHIQLSTGWSKGTHIAVYSFVVLYIVRQYFLQATVLQCGTLYKSTHRRPSDNAPGNADGIETFMRKQRKGNKILSYEKKTMLTI